MKAQKGGRMRNFVVFDLDGTLLDTLPDIAGAMNRVLFRHGLPQHPEESYKLFTGNGARMLTRRALAGHEEMLEDVYPEYLADYGRHNRVGTKPYDGIPRLLESLAERGIALMVFSNKDDEDTRDVVSHYFPGVPFAAVAGSRPDLPLKPDPEALNRMMKERGLSPENGVYLGDTVMDMQCAKAAGLYPVAALWGFQTREMLSAEQPARFIGHPLELLDIARERFAPAGG